VDLAALVRLVDARRTQTFGHNFESDRRPMGTEDIQTVNCDTMAHTCGNVVPFSGFALVFLNDDAFTEDKGAPSTTFSTTARTKTHNTGACLFLSSLS
jgi:hypothetical protein